MKKYRITKVLNNNAVEVTDNGNEGIVIGNGIGFQNRVHSMLMLKPEYKLYALTNKNVKEQFKVLLNEIPFDCIDLTQKIIDMAKINLKKEFNQGLLISLADHIHFVVKRTIENKKTSILVSEEIKRFYNEEYKIAVSAVKEINKYYNIRLSEREANAICFHIVNAEFDNNLSQTESVLESIDKIMSIIRKNLGIELPEESLYYSRLVIHLRFFMQSIIKGETDNTNHFEELVISNKTKLNQEIESTITDISEYLQSEFEYTITSAERFYLLVNIIRII